MSVTIPKFSIEQADAVAAFLRRSSEEVAERGTKDKLSPEEAIGRALEGLEDLLRTGKAHPSKAAVASLLKDFYERLQRFETFDWAVFTEDRERAIKGIRHALLTPEEPEG